ncbi:MAG: ABC transporter ATP-binding protein [Acidobacteria bacterium]|nr:ABC transporter ATP-binding protein [Acidobacteriota bacterium]
MPAIEILGLEKTYQVGFWRKRPKRALEPLHLAVETGEIFGFLGPNGAGKTTTLKLLMGLVLPTAGTARILGMELDDPRMKAQIGFLPEQPYFYDYLTGRELLNYYGRLSGVDGKELPPRIDRVLEEVQLRESANLQLRNFSKGMLQRLGIAQAILHDPKVIFLDEPMSGLDPMGRREVRNLIEEWNAQGKTIFFSTHLLSDAEALCDRVAILDQGQLRGVGRIADLAANVHGKVEIVWHGGAAPGAIRSMSLSIHTAANTTRAVVADESQDAVLDLLRRDGLRLISVTPVRASLEDYFLARLGGAGKPEMSPAPS